MVYNWGIILDVNSPAKLKKPTPVPDTFKDSTKKKGRPKKEDARSKVRIAGLPSGTSVSRVSNGHGGDYYRVRLGKRYTGGPVQYKRYKTLDEIRVWMGETDEQTKTTGQETYSLSVGQLAEAKAAFECLKPYDKSLTDAVSYFLKHTQPRSGRIGWGEALERWLSEPGDKPRDAKTERRYRNSVNLLKGFFLLKKFFEKPKAKELGDVTPEDLKKFIYRKEWKSASQAHHFRNLRAFFGWMVKAGHRADHPMTGFTQPDSSGKIKILTPDQAQKLLESAASPEMRICIALGLFGGLRTCEIQRLQWDQISESKLSTDTLTLKEEEDDDEMEINEDQAKTRKHRMFAILPRLRYELDQYKGNRAGPVAPVGAEWDRQWESTTLAAGWRDEQKQSNWPTNAMRHSFGTYRLKALAGNVHSLADEMGNSSAMILKHYRRLVKKSVMRAYWAFASVKKPKGD